MLLYPMTWEHGSLALNSHLNSDGTVDETAVQSSIIVDQRKFTPVYRDTRDPYHLAQGGALGRVHKGSIQLQLRGRIEAPDATQVASLSDTERSFRSAFDPYLCDQDSPSTDGAYRLLFTEPTTDSVTWANGRIPQALYLRPAAEPEMIEAQSDRAFREWALTLIAADPRVYGQTAKTLTLNSGTSSGNLVNNGTTPAPLKAVITLTGAGASNFTITVDGTAFVLDLSGLGAGAHTVTVYFETAAPWGEGRKITNGSSRAFSLKTSDVASWLAVPVGTTAASITHLTNVTSVVLTYYDTWA